MIFQILCCKFWKFSRFFVLILDSLGYF